MAFFPPPSSCECELAHSSNVNTSCHRDVTYTYREYVLYNCYTTGPLTLAFVKRHVPCMRRALRRKQRRNAVPYPVPNPMVPGREAKQSFSGEVSVAQPLVPAPEKELVNEGNGVHKPLEKAQAVKEPRLMSHGKVMAGGPKGTAQSGGTYLPRADQLRRACAYLSDLKFFFAAMGTNQRDTTALVSEAAHTLYEEAVEDMRDDCLVSGAQPDEEISFPTPVTDDVELPGLAAAEQYAEDLRLWGFPKHGIPKKIDPVLQKYADFRVRCGPGGTTVFDPLKPSGSGCK